MICVFLELLCAQSLMGVLVALVINILVCSGFNAWGWGGTGNEIGLLCLVVILFCNINRRLSAYIWFKIPRYVRSHSIFNLVRSPLQLNTARNNNVATVELSSSAALRTISFNPICNASGGQWSHIFPQFTAPFWKVAVPLFEARRTVTLLW